MPKKSMFCPHCNEWVKEPSVQSWGPQWTRFHQGVCPKCETHLLEREPTSTPASERIESQAVLESPSERRGLKLPHLFGRKAGHATDRPREEPERLKTEHESKIAGASSKGNTLRIGALFDIDDLEKLAPEVASYGQTAWTVVMKAIDPLRVSRSSLFCGDVPIPGYKRPESFCAAIETISPERAEYFRGVLDASDHRSLLPRKNRFVTGQQTYSYSHLIPSNDGYIDSDGRFVMHDTDCYWLFSAAAAAGWRYLPSRDWLGKSAAEFLERQDPKALPLGDKFTHVWRQALREAGRGTTMYALKEYLKIVGDDELTDLCRRHLGALEEIWAPR